MGQLNAIERIKRRQRLGREQRCESVISAGIAPFPRRVAQFAKRAVGRMTGYLDSSAFAGPYLADQLLLPFALAGSGALTTVKPSQHSLTAAAVIERFLDRRCVFTQLPGGSHKMEVR